MLSCRVIFSDTSHFVIRSQRTMRAAIMMWYFRMVSIRRSICAAILRQRGFYPTNSLSISFSAARASPHKLWITLIFSDVSRSNPAPVTLSVPALFY